VIHNAVEIYRFIRNTSANRKSLLSILTLTALQTFTVLLVQAELNRILTLFRRSVRPHSMNTMNNGHNKPIVKFTRTEQHCPTEHIQRYYNSFYNSYRAMFPLFYFLKTFTHSKQATTDQLHNLHTSD